MDHLPLPRVPALPRISVPLLATEAYDEGPFLNYPERRGWRMSRLDDGKRVYLCDNRVPSAVEAKSFLQTWLYFGLLHEAIGSVYKTFSFSSTDTSGATTVDSTKLEKVVIEWTTKLVPIAARSTKTVNGDMSVVDFEAVQRQCTHLNQCLWETRRLSQTISTNSEIYDQLTWLAIAVLGEYLMQAIKDVYTWLFLDKSVLVEISWRKPDEHDCGRPILSLMRRNGWCPYDVAVVDAQTRHVGVLYYHANLEPPRSSKNHSGCSDSSCTVLSIHPATYELAHSQNGCTCLGSSLDFEVLEGILRQGALPLIRSVTDSRPVHPPNQTNQVKGNEEKVSACHQVAIQGWNLTEDFVAISHVWAEGLGNPVDNVLQGCVLYEVSRKVNQLPKASTESTTPFWIDTLCVPVRPPELKALALNMMAAPYQKAKQVLVLDGYLQSVESKLLSPVEVFARIFCCTWMRRLWTLQESRLAKEVWFEFADGAVEVRAIWESLSQHFVAARFRVSRYIEMHIACQYEASPLDGCLAGFVNGSILSLRSALSTRTVSVATDEVLCLACLMGLEMAAITAVPPSARMKIFWGLIPKVPAGLVFSRAQQKLSEPGFRWAPSSFLSLLPSAHASDHWAGPYGVNHNAVATLTEAGLMLALPGFIFRPYYSIQLDTKPLIQDREGRWYSLTYEEPYNRPEDCSETPQCALILSSILQDHISSDLDSGFEHQSETTGILASITRVEKGIFFVKARRHITITLLGTQSQAYFHAARRYAQDIITQRRHPCTHEPSSANGNGSRSAETLDQECARKTMNALQDLSTKGIVYGKSRFLHGLDVSEDRMIEDFSREVRLFVEDGESVMVEETSDMQQWCVD